MQNNERKEVIQVSGLTIMVVMTLIADMLIGGIIVRWHNYVVVRHGMEHLILMRDLYRQENELQTKIVMMEGVKTWNDTAYIKTLK